MRTRRFLSFVVAVCMMFALTPKSLAAETSFTINGITVSASSGTAVNNCSTYAGQILKKIWTVKAVMTTYNNSYNLLKNKSAEDRKLTEAHVKEYIQSAPLGSRIRICASSDTTTNNYDNSSQGHTLVLVAKDDSAGTFTVLHAGWGAAAASTYTYKGFANTWVSSKGYNYFFYIADYSAAATNYNRNEDGTTPSLTAHYSSCNVRIACVSGQAVNLYNNPGDSTRVTYFSKGQTVMSTYLATLNDGSIWYRVTANNNGSDQTFWLKYESNKMSVTPINLTYTVIFNANGGSVSPATKTVAVGSEVGSMPTPIRQGYTFIGWELENSNLMLLRGDEIVVDKDITLYAYWRPEATSQPTSYTVYFDANGGNVSQSSKTVAPGSSYGTLPTPSRSNHTFDGWYTSAGGGSQVTSNTIFNSSSSVTLYAHWTKVETGHWGPWSEWSNTPYQASSTREVETRQAKVSEGHTEYRYGRYIDSTGTHDCWCGKYLEGLSYVSGGATLQYSTWTIQQYSTSGKDWSCGYCNGTHIGVHHTGTDGRAWWKEYLLPSGSYYWEESRWVDAVYETQYRYRDWIVD
ncbi:MAG: InlB B-repeat-containing protein [Oscillibacter sp.]|nr:InlB B-repeat-containing protein [Oscillibacter sp.]